MAENPVPPSVKMLDFISGFWAARALSAAAELGVADVLADGPKTLEQLAAATKTDPPSLRRLMRGLASVEVFREASAGVYESTPLGDTLRTGVTGSMRYAFISGIGSDHYDAWAGITDAVRTGVTAFDRIFKQGIWEFYAANATNGRNFMQYMTDLTTVVDPALLKACDYSGFKHLIDIGGGHGQLLSAILKAHPNVRGTVFDMPKVIEGTRGAIAKANLTGRCDAIAGDFFESVPAGGDGYMMKFIIHDWDDAKSNRILRNIRKGITADGKLLLFEIVLSEGNERDFGKFMDLNMLVMTGGRERSAGEYRELLRGGGFKLERIIPSESLFSVIEASPV